MKIRYQLSMIALLVGLVMLSGCDRQPSRGPGAGAKQPVIVASIEPLASLTKHLVEDWAEVHTVIPPGTSEHTFDLTAEAMRRLAEADVVVLVGMGLDDWIIDRTRESLKPEVKILRFTELIRYPSGAQGVAGSNNESGEYPPHVCADHGHDHDHDHPALPEAWDAGTADTPAQEGISLKTHVHSHEGPNVHVWLDPVMTAEFVRQLGRELEPYFPDRLPSLRGRTTLTFSNCLLLDREFAMSLVNVKRKELVTFHQAFDLLCRRYGLRPVAHLTHVEFSPGGDVTADHMVKAIEAIRKYELNVVYSEPQFPDAYAKSLAEQTGVRVLMLDPLGNPDMEGYKDYFEMMRSNARTIFEGQTMK